MESKKPFQQAGDIPLPSVHKNPEMLPVPGGPFESPGKLRDIGDRLAEGDSKELPKPESEEESKSESKSENDSSSFADVVSSKITSDVAMMTGPLIDKSMTRAMIRAEIFLKAAVCIVYHQYF